MLQCVGQCVIIHRLNHRGRWTIKTDKILSLYILQSGRNPIFILCNPHRLWQDCRIAKYCRIAECYWKIGKVVSWTATKSFKIHMWLQWDFRVAVTCRVARFWDRMLTRNPTHWFHSPMKITNSQSINPQSTNPDCGGISKNKAIPPRCNPKSNLT